MFGAHRTYHVTNGSSMSNRVILMASVTRNQVALCDRNCHKSAEHAMTMSGAIPTYLIPSRNHYGIIGPIMPERLTAAAVRLAIDANPLVRGRDGIDPTPVHALITNSTYDGLCYNVARVEALLGQSVDRLHFDEAWYGYARFNPIYRDRHAMHGDPSQHDASKPTVFATQSTHKLLAALSQASFIHVRDGRNPIEHARFNEAYMMHASTSPNYAIIASNDVSAAMMDGPGGEALTTDAIREAVAFRQMLARLHTECAENNDWFFNGWQPDSVVDRKTGRRVRFHEADETLLATDPSCWVLHPGDTWHGFGDIEDDYCMLDPIKVSIVTPGVAAHGGLMPVGIPASVVTAYLDRHGIVVEKTTDFTILFLFSLGVTKGKWGTLVNTLLDFKRDYDANAPLEQALPELVARYPERYGKLGLRDLCDLMFSAMSDLRTTEMMSRGFSTLPKPDYSPAEAFEHLVHNDIEMLELAEMEGRTVATGVVPYPPGIPLLMPGENAGPTDGPLLGYLKALEQYDLRFPGFMHDTRCRGRGWRVSHRVHQAEGARYPHALSTQCHATPCRRPAVRVATCSRRRPLRRPASLGDARSCATAVSSEENVDRNRYRAQASRALSPRLIPRRYAAEPSPRHAGNAGAAIPRNRTRTRRDLRERQRRMRFEHVLRDVHAFADQPRERRHPVASAN